MAYTKEEQKEYNQEYYQRNKDSIKEQAREYRKKNKEKYSAYHKEYQQRPEERAKRVERQRLYRKKFKIKFQARRKVGTALRNGTLVKKPCDVCGAEKVEAHHADYTKPLEVRWLCPQHHREVEGRSL